MIGNFHYFERCGDPGFCTGIRILYARGLVEQDSRPNALRTGKSPKLGRSASPPLYEVLPGT